MIVSVSAVCEAGKIRVRSRYSARSANLDHADPVHAVKISIHALHTECDQDPSSFPVLGAISIHALHTECDDAVGMMVMVRDDISIHALHTECDKRAC